MIEPILFIVNTTIHTHKCIHILKTIFITIQDGQAKVLEQLTFEQYYGQKL